MSFHKDRGISNEEFKKATGIDYNVEFENEITKAFGNAKKLVAAYPEAGNPKFEVRVERAGEKYGQEMGGADKIVFTIGFASDRLNPYQKSALLEHICSAEYVGIVLKTGNGELMMEADKGVWFIKTLAAVTDDRIRFVNAQAAAAEFRR